MEKNKLKEESQKHLETPVHNQIYLYIKGCSGWHTAVYSVYPMEWS